VATSKRLPILVVVLWSCCVCAVLGQANATVIINELHTDPDVKTELIEFVELYNYGSEAIDLSGWSLAGGVFFTFPAGTSLPADGYLVVVQSPEHVMAGRTAAGFNVPESLVYGPFAGKLSNDGERVVLADAEGEVVDEVTYQLGFPWPTVGDPTTNNQPGTGASMQLVNPRLDNDLGGSWRSGRPTPASQNRGFSDNVAPQIRQVKHTPNQPRSDQDVTITAKITDPDGVQTPSLTYQVVTPGNYVSLQDATYNADWTVVDMHDDGLDGDVTAHDGTYTVQIPAAEQVHRGLVRYRIFAVDGRGDNVTAPYADDPQPNFAYFVYDGVPAWAGAIRPDAGDEAGDVVEYSSEVLQSLPVYHLIVKNQDVLDALHMPGAHGGEYWGSDYPWYATLVYDGTVYDHITFRARGGVWRYSMGKNMLKADFKRGHYFQGRDDYGRKYDTTWDKMNFSACIQQGDYQHRGEQGMFEAAAFKLFNMMGVEAPKTNWLHFRVIDEADEIGPSQYDGDFWGLYMTIEQMDGRFLNEHSLPDGNLYKIEGGSGDLNNQGATAVTDGSDVRAFTSGYRSRPQSDWWYDNVNLAGYYGYRCVVEGVHHGDIASGKNWFFYLNPETSKWSMLPWDVDLTWANNMYGSGRDDFLNAGQIFSNDDLEIAYQNRLREFLDLLYNADQLYQFLDEMANVIDPPTGGPTFVEADRAMWDYNPIMTSNVVRSSKAGQGRFYQRAATHDFRGMVQIMKNYVVSSNRGFDSYFEDPDIPQTPVVAATGPADFPMNALTFRASPFGDSQGPGTFSAMKWRLGEVAAGSQIVQTDSSGFTFVPDGAQWNYFKGIEEPSEEVGAWREADFDDATWLAGQTAIGFGEGFIATNLSDMRGNYSTVYLRKSFDVAGVSTLDGLILELKYDDGINVWVNGHLVFQDNVEATDLPYDATSISAIEVVDFVSYDLGVPSELLVDGTNVVAIQLLNASLAGSSDCFVDVRLTGEKAEDTGDDETPTTPQVYRGRPGKYEIDPVWESAELTEFNADVTVPAAVVRSGRTYRLRCCMQDTTGRWSHWSAPVQFVAGEAVAAGILADLRLTELMYNPADAPAGDAAGNDEFEFIELQNVGDETLDLSTVSLTDGVTFDFAGSDVTTLGPGQFVLVVRSRDAFLARYGVALGNLIAGEYQGQLSNGGENVKLEDFWNGTIAEFEYSDGRGWPLAADGTGHSLVPLAEAILEQPVGSLNYGGNWRASATMGGSPGADDLEPAPSIVINEFYAGGGAEDWIELHNPTEADIDLADFYLSDDVEDLAKWAVAAPVLETGAFRSFEESGDDLGFGLSRSGEQLILSYLPGTGEDRIVDSVRFKAQENTVSQGRYPDGGPWWFRLELSRDQANLMPIADVVIDEVMYHPIDVNDEYVEVLNPTDVAIELTNPTGAWRLTGGVEYTFGAGLSLAPAGRLVVVGFDPFVETARLDAFVASYGVESLVPGADVVGPWQGSLANAGERLALEKPQATGNVDNPIAWVIVDEVIYSDVAPWPTAPDGTGNALERADTDPSASGNDPANWHAAPPTPGVGL
jgi:lamin tail-like protein/CotH protein